MWGRPSQSKRATQCHECHACHAKRWWIWDCATPATWNEGGLRLCHACRAKCRGVPGVTGDQASPSAPPSAMSATPATRNDGGCEIVCVWVCVKLLYVKFVCVWSYCMWEIGMWQSCVCECVWRYCMWSYSMWQMVCDKVVCVWVCVKLLYVKFVCCVCVSVWRREAGGGGGGGDLGYRIKNKNPTQSCGEINPQTIPNNSVPLNPKDWHPNTLAILAILRFFPLFPLKKVFLLDLRIQLGHASAIEHQSRLVNKNDAPIRQILWSLGPVCCSCWIKSHSTASTWSIQWQFVSWQGGMGQCKNTKVFVYVYVYMSNNL